MYHIIVNKKALGSLLLLILLLISFQIYIMVNILELNIPELRRISKEIKYSVKNPDATLAEVTLERLIGGLKKNRKNSENTSSFEAFLFSFYPHPYVNLTSQFQASQKVFSKESEFNAHLIKLDKLLNDKQDVCSKTALIGGWSCETRVDGAKPICINYIPPNDACLVYSFGIGHDFSFEKSIANYGCQVFAFDDDDAHYYDNALGENVYFFKVRLGASLQIVDVNDRVTKKEYRYLYRPLDNIMYIMEHDDLSIDILKMDVDGDEWEILNESLCKSDILKRTKQLVIETHLEVLANFTNVKEEHLASNISYYNKALECLANHSFVLSSLVPNDVRPTFSIVRGFIFRVNEEQLWINTKFDAFTNKAKKTRDIKPKNLEKISILMENRSI